MPGKREEFTLKKGEVINLHFKGLATAGYEWNYRVKGPKNCVKISKDFDLPKNPISKNTGGTLEEIFTISAIKPGVVDVHFRQDRSWEKGTGPVNEKRVKIIVE